MFLLNPLSLLADLVLDMLLPPGEGPGAGAGRLGVGGRALEVIDDEKGHWAKTNANAKYFCT